MCAWISARPSVRAAGPGCRIIDGLDLVQLAVAHRRDRDPSRDVRRPVAARNFLPHQDPKTRSGARRTTSAGSAMMRSRPSGIAARSAKAIVAARGLDQLAHPADAGDQRLVPFLEIDARAARQLRGFRARRLDTGFEAIGKRGGPRLAADHAAQHPDHAQDLGDAAMVEEVHLDPRARELARRCPPAGPRSRARGRARARRMRSIFALVKADTRGFSRRARGGRTVNPEMPTMRRSSPRR